MFWWQVCGLYTTLVIDKIDTIFECITTDGPVSKKS